MNKSIFLTPNPTKIQPIDLKKIKETQPTILDLDSYAHTVRSKDTLEGAPCPETLTERIDVIRQNGENMLNKFQDQVKQSITKEEQNEQAKDPKRNSQQFQMQKKLKVVGRNMGGTQIGFRQVTNMGTQMSFSPSEQKQSTLQNFYRKQQQLSGDNIMIIGDPVLEMMPSKKDHPAKKTPLESQSLEHIIQRFRKSHSVMK